MQNKKKLYLYPFTKATLRAGGNTYIPNLISHLSRHVEIVNTQTTSLGLLDVLIKMPKCDVLYFNWIEDVADKRFGALQVLLLGFILILAKTFNIKVVWFVHNKLSHKKTNRWLKKRVLELMKRYADCILSHSGELQIAGATQKIAVFHHPVEPYKPISSDVPYEYDLLIWGTVNPYKGVDAFLQFNRNNTSLNNFKILIAGKFVSKEYYEALHQLATPNITLQNKILSEDELITVFSKCRYVLFTYNSTSVLSSAALCKTLSYGKTIIGPAVGAFKELGAKGFIYNYTSFEELEPLLFQLEHETLPLNQFKLQEYIEQHSWERFSDFIAGNIYNNRAVHYAKAV
jgi:beta-1,4-mannosyltransferase